MKRIIIVLLIIIASLIGYSQYKQYKRFSPPEYEYQVNKNIDLNYHNQSLILDYHQSIEELNAYVISQWSSNNIDVRNPENNNKSTVTAISKYAKKLGKVRFYETQLLKSTQLKKDGLNNNDIILLEEKGITKSDYKKALEYETLKTMFHSYSSKNNLRLGSKNALIFEIQKILVKKGYEIPVDGFYKHETFNAIKDFQEKNSLYSSGNIDLLTFNALLK